MTNKKINNYFEQESGRSMVEMLGVLAIIGVLSVGGISGYTTAMNKHKANEILNAAAVRAMVVSSQLQSGTPIGSVSLGEFDNENSVGGATFGNVTDAGNNRFTIGFDMDNEAVLKQMQNIAGTDGIVRDLTGTGITYNNDLTADKIASDYKNENDCKTPYTWCAALKTCQNAGETCECPANSSTTSTTEGPITGTTCYCNSGYKLEGNTCKSTGPTCTGNEHEVEYGGSKHCVEIVSGKFNHAQAYNECLNVSTGRHLMEKSEFESAFTDDGGNYSADLAAKLGWGSSFYWMWLGTCTTKTCEAAGYLNTDGTMKEISLSDLSDNSQAWAVGGDGFITYDFRYSDLSYYALCVKD